MLESNPNLVGDDGRRLYGMDAELFLKVLSVLFPAQGVVLVFLLSSVKEMLSISLRS